MFNIFTSRFLLEDGEVTEIFDWLRFTSARLSLIGATKHTLKIDKVFYFGACSVKRFLIE